MRAWRGFRPPSPRPAHLRPSPGPSPRGSRTRRPPPDCALLPRPRTPGATARGVSRPWTSRRRSWRSTPSPSVSRPARSPRSSRPPTRRPRRPTRSLRAALRAALTRARRRPPGRPRTRARLPRAPTRPTRPRARRPKRLPSRRRRRNGPPAAPFARTGSSGLEEVADSLQQLRLDGVRDRRCADGERWCQSRGGPHAACGPVCPPRAHRAPGA